MSFLSQIWEDHIRPGQSPAVGGARGGAGSRDHSLSRPGAAACAGADMGDSDKAGGDSRRYGVRIGVYPRAVVGRDDW